MRNLIPLLTFVVLMTTIATGHAEEKHTRASAGAEFIYGQINSPFAFIPAELDTTLIGIAAMANYRLTNEITIGGKIPIAHRRFNERSSTSLGNLTLTLRYQLSHNQVTSSKIITSFSFPTSDDDAEGGITATTFAFFWIPDPGLYLPNTTTFRAGYEHKRSFEDASVTFRVGMQYLSIDGQDNRARFPILIRGDIALNPTVSVIGRFGTYWEASAEDSDDAFLHVLEAGLQFKQVGDGILSAILYLPLDNTYRDNLETIGIKLAYLKAF